MTQPSIKSAHIVFDVDDVVADFNRSLRFLLAEKFGTPDIIDDHDHFTGFQIEKQYTQVQDAKTELFDVMLDRGMMSTLAPRPNYVALVNQFYDLGWHVTFLTARGWFDDAPQVTWEWLNRNGLKFHQLIVSPYRECKSNSFPMAHGYPTLYVDDSATHLLGCQTLFTLGFLVDKSYNRGIELPSNIVRQPDLDTPGGPAIDIARVAHEMIELALSQ